MKIVPKRKWRHPLALEREYSKYLVKFVDDNMEVAKQFTPEIADWIRTYAFRFDSTITELEILLDKMHATMKKPEQMSDIVTSMAIRVDRYNRSEWQAITKSVLGMPIRDVPIRKIHQDAEADDALREIWVSENLDLIKSIDQQTMQRIKQSMQEKIVGAVNRRELTRELTGEMERIAGLERNRAVLIARDQVGKLNGRLMQYRQQHAGITEYIWVTSGDRRVRQSHDAINGKTFTWGPENPAPEGSPGIPVRCRCVADPIIDLDKIVTEPVPGSYTQVQEYRPISLSSTKEVYKRIDKEFPIREVESTVNKIYKSDSVDIKPRAIHFIDRNITKALSVIKAGFLTELPKIILVSELEMQTGAVASYIPATNEMLIQAIAGDKAKLLELQKGMACPNNPLSTFVHEFLHWQDAIKYVKKYGKIDKNYFIRLRAYSKERLAALGRKWYNNISQYANNKYRTGQFDEAYTEYRTKRLLGGYDNENNSAGWITEDG